MTSKPILAIVYASLIATGLACGSSTSASPTKTLTVEAQLQSPTSTETVILSLPSPETLDEVTALIQNALVSKDIDLIRPLMGDAFSMSYVDASGGFIATDDALRLLQRDLLGGPTSINFDGSVNARTILDDIPTPTDLHIARLLFSRGWGVSGKDQALVLIAESPDGSFFFAGVIYARGGFANVPVAPTTEAALTFPAPTAAAAEELAPVPHGALAYQSDFQSGWAIFNEQQITSRQTNEGYAMSVQGPWAGWAYTTQVSRNEFYAEITAHPSECPSGHGTYGLLFHYVDPSNFRAFVVWCSGLFSAFQRTETSRAALLVEGALPQSIDVSSGEHRIGVLSSANSLTFYVDDYKVGQIDVPESPIGDMGPYVESTGSQTTSILFTELNVYSP